jgi:repressor LexA
MLDGGDPLPSIMTVLHIHTVPAMAIRPQRAPRRPFAHLDAPPAGGKRSLTPRQQQILDWMRGYIEANGMPPTRAEIAKGLGFSTPSSAEDHLQALARKGALELVPGASRGLRLKALPGLPQQGTLPLVGRVAAGAPLLAAEHIEARYRVDPELFAPRADYLLRVRGASMRDAGILDGDLLAVHATAEARAGQIVVARLGGRAGDEVTVKRFRRRGREVVLVAENPAFEPIVVDPAVTPFAIEGVGVGLIRAGRSF